jgi:hypothetical protein
MPDWIPTTERLPTREDCDEKGAVWVFARDALFVEPRHIDRVTPDRIECWQPRPKRHRPTLPRPLT